MVLLDCLLVVGYTCIMSELVAVLRVGLPAFPSVLLGVAWVRDGESGEGLIRFCAVPEAGLVPLLKAFTEVEGFHN